MKSLMVILTILSTVIIFNLGAIKIPDIVSYWRFDEGEGGIAYDSVGENHGTIQGANWTNGVLDGALEFNSNYVSVPDSPSIRIERDITIEAWVYPYAMTSPEQGNWAFIAAKEKWEAGVTTASYGLFAQMHWQPGFHFLVLTSEGEKVIRTDPGKEYPVKWYHIAGVYDGSEIRLYMDGEFQVSIPHSGNIIYNNQPFYISRNAPYNSQDHYFRGKIDEVAIYDKALSGLEIKQHYQNGIGGMSYITIHVSPNGNDNTGNGTESKPYLTIQKGIDQARNGDIVLVADGIYTGTGNVNLDFSGKAITVKSENGPENCIIDCENIENTRGFYFHSGEGLDSVLDGFTIQNGRIFIGEADGLGGAILCRTASPTITNNIIRWNNVNGIGGGIFCMDSSATIKNNVIIQNRVELLHGGGIGCSYSELNIVGNVIIENWSSGDGGGIACFGSNPTISNNIITKNATDSNGGGLLICSDSTIKNNIITENQAGYSGGGMFCNGSLSSKIINNTIARNSANQGSGIGALNYADLLVINTILWNDSGKEISLENQSTINITYSDIQGGWVGEGNIDKKPLFVNAFDGNYRLSNYSPCIGSGTLTPDVPDKDIEGNNRPNPPGSSPDMGAYENILGIPSPAITLISPNGGEIWAGGKNKTILWETLYPEPHQIQLLYSTDSGVTYPYSIVAAIDDNGSYEWSALNLDSATVRVKAFITTEPSLFDSSDGDFMIDSTPPQTETDVQPISGGAGEWICWTGDVLLILYPKDNLSGVKGVWYKLNEETWNLSSPDGYAVGLTSSNDILYYKAEDNAGNLEDEKTVSICIDKTPPLPPIVTDDGDFTNDNNQLHASWTGASDPESDIWEYVYYIGTTPGGDDVFPMDMVLAPLSEVTVEGLSLVHGETYYFSVEARNGVGYFSEPGISDGITVDLTPPTKPIVTDDGKYSRSLTQLHAYWISNDPESGILEYQYAIGTAPDNMDVLDWTSAGLNIEITVANLSLIDGQTYYFYVKAKNGAGSWSEPGMSDGIKIDETPAIVSYWRFDEGEGGIAYDSVGENHGTIQGANWTNGVLDGALEFNSNYVSVPDSPSIRIERDITIEAWVYPYAMTSPEQGNWAFIAAKEKWEAGVTTASYGLFAQMHWQPGFHFVLLTSEGEKVIRTEPSKEYPVKWYHIAGVYDGSEIRLYMDGEFQVSVPHSGDIIYNNQPFYISRDTPYNSHDHYFRGKIDEVAIYDKVLSSSEIKQHYKNGIDGISYITIHVSPTGNDNTGNGTESKPYLTIQKGIDQARNGDIVLVDDGIYSGGMNFNGKAITVKSKNGSENCIIDCNNSSIGFTFDSWEGPDSVVDGFTIKNGTTGIYCNGEEDSCSPTISNNVITGNSNGIVCLEASPLIIGNFITKNNGWGISIHSHSEPMIINNVISDNTAEYGGGIYSFLARATIINCTITGNLATSQEPDSIGVGGGILCSDHADIKIINTIIWGNAPYEMLAFNVHDPEPFNVSYSNIRGGWIGEGNINKEPLFVNSAVGNYHLSNFSPCIGAGNMAQNMPDKDIEGNSRPNPSGSNPDMGAYENPLADPLISLIVQAFSPVDIVVTDPQGRVIDKNKSEIPGGIYEEMDLDNDGDLDDRVIIPDPLPGNYSIDVIPEPGANPMDTYSLETIFGDEKTNLAENEKIQNIPSEGYSLFNQRREMSAGWNLVSFSVNKCFYYGSKPNNQPSCVELVDVAKLGFGSLAEWLSSVITPSNGWQMVIGMEGAMDSSLPAVFHSLKYMSPCSGYWIKIKGGLSDANISIFGNLFDPKCPIPLLEGWNLIGYPLDIGYHDTALSPNIPWVNKWQQANPPVADYVFKSIRHNYNMIIGEFGAYNPELPPTFSSLRYIVPGQGYWIKVKQNVNLVYSEAGEALYLAPPVAMMRISPIKPTNTAMIIYGNAFLDDESAKAGTKVQVFNETGVLCGYSEITQNGYYGMMMVYGDYKIEGAETEKRLSFYLNGEKVETVEDIYWLGDKIIQRIDLTARTLPKASMMGQNYPNPFNPDTWIPYELKENALVEIAIYTNTGQLVRTLKLGEKPAGFYTSKDKAAYWDGRNEFGEGVASGIYFYTIKAGDFTAIRKMIVIK